MKNFFEYAKNKGITVPEGNIPGDWFAKNGFPMVVRCSCCEMSMAIPEAFIDDDGYVFCPDCAGAKEGD